MVLACLGLKACNAQENASDNGNQKNPVPTIYATLDIDRKGSGSAVTGDFDPYLGPASMDLDSKGNLYLLNMDNSIQKYSPDGKRVWSKEHDSQQFDIKVYKDRIYSFNGKVVFSHSLDNGTIRDTFFIEIENNDYTPIGNVSRFYGRYLFINRWFIKEGKELVYVFDLESEQVSPKVPEKFEFYPIVPARCSACSLHFVEEMFQSRSLHFVSQSDKYVAYYHSKKNEIGIFDKRTGDSVKYSGLPNLIATMTIRFAYVRDKGSFILCTLKTVNFEPEALVFYEIDIPF